MDIDPDRRHQRGSPVAPRGVRGWWHFARRVWHEASADHMALLAAGVAFFGFISLFPALVATGLVYGLVSDPGQVANQIAAVSGALPESAQNLLTTQLRNLAQASERNLGFGLVVALMVALWGASTATSNLISAVNAAHDHTLRRSFIRRRALALLLTVGAILFVSFAVGLIAVVPVVVDALDLPDDVVAALGFGRWVGLFVGALTALAVLYRLAPFQTEVQVSSIAVGTVVAASAWLAVSAGFSLYVNRFASYSSTYGSLAGVIVLLLWLWLAAFAALLGAEVNAEVERRRADGESPARP